MALHLHIDRFAWDWWNVDHIAKHGVHPDEVADVAAGAPVVLATYKGRYQLIGPSSSGRVLAVVVGEAPNDQGVFDAFGARPVNHKGRRLFEQHRGGSGEPGHANR